MQKKTTSIITGAIVAIASTALAVNTLGLSAPPVDTGTTSPDVLAALDGLPLNNSSTPGYAREEFGQRWKDTDRNGCDQRNDVLARDLTDVTFKPGTGNCKVTSGTLADPYTGTVITTEDRQQLGDQIHIDHVVPLALAWDLGASEWTPEQREIFANDPEELLAVSTSANTEKSDAGPAEWMPSTGQCAYAERFVAVLSKYELTVFSADRDSLRETLTACLEGAS